MIMRAYTDGGSRGNPGEGAIGIVLLEGERLVLERGERIGRCTNNHAEYRAVIRALELAAGHGARQVACTLDSQLVVRQLAGAYQVRNPRLKELHTLLRQKERLFEEVTYAHAPRTNPFIQRADRLVNETLDRAH